jgi:hypothetical protein
MTSNRPGYRSPIMHAASPYRSDDLGKQDLVVFFFAQKLIQTHTFFGVCVCVSACARACVFFPKSARQEALPTLAHTKRRVFGVTAQKTILGMGFVAPTGPAQTSDAKRQFIGRRRRTRDDQAREEVFRLSNQPMCPPPCIKCCRWSTPAARCGTPPTELCVATFAVRHNRGLCWEGVVPRWL